MLDACAVMATLAVREGLRAAGMDVSGDGADWTLTPRTLWFPGEPRATGAVEAIDEAGVVVRLSLGGQERVCTVTAPPGMANRLHIDSCASAPFTLPVCVGERVRVEAWATCSTRADGSRLRGGPLERTLVVGEFEVPAELHALGCAGTGVMISDSSYMFLHAANVAGEVRYVAVHLSVLVDA